MKGTGCTPNLCSITSVPIPNPFRLCLCAESCDSLALLFSPEPILGQVSFPYRIWTSRPCPGLWQFPWGTELWFVAVYSCFAGKSWRVLWGFLFSQIFLKFMKFSPRVRPVWHLSKSFSQVLFTQPGTLMGRQPGTLHWCLASCQTQSEK